MPVAHTLRACCSAALVALMFKSTVLRSQSASYDTLNMIIPSGANFDVSEFRRLVPSGVGQLCGIVVLTLGSNGDSRSAVHDRAFADGTTPPYPTAWLPTTRITKAVEMAR